MSHFRVLALLFQSPVSLQSLVSSLRKGVHDLPHGAGDIGCAPANGVTSPGALPCGRSDPRVEFQHALDLAFSLQIK